MNVKKAKLRKKSKRLATTLVLFSIATLLILNLVSAVCIGTLTSSGMNQKQDAFLQQTTLSGKRQVEQFIEQYIGITETLAQSTQLQHAVTGTAQDRPISGTPEFSEALVLLHRTMEEYPDILGVGFGSLTEDYIYNQEGTRLNVLLSEWPYFQNAKEGTYVTQPYIDSATDEMCVSVATPLSDGTATAGLLILGLKLTQVSDFLKGMDFGESGRIVLLSENNTILGHENHDMIGKNFSELDIQGELLEQLEEPTNEIVNYKLDGEPCVGIVQELSGGGWKVLSSMSKAEYNAQTTKTTVSLVLLLLGSTAIVAILLWIIIVKRLRPISQLNDALREMSMGNLHIAVTHNGADEVGEMAESMRECIRNLSGYVNEIDRVMGCLAQGDLTIQTDVAFQGDFMPIQHSIEGFIQKLSAVMSSIQLASEQVFSGSDQVSSGAQALAQGATEQASSVEELAAAVTEISSTVKENHAIVKDAASGALQVNSDIVESGKRMRQSLAFMTEIRERSNEISHIIKTIEDIAFQTNILALNAAVEAARAGQAGKGFAVVADEVRSLAGKTAEASNSTTSLIAASLAAVEKGTESMETTSKFMESVVEEAQKITDVFQNIANASERQSVSIEQVTQGIDQISSVVQTNSATAEQSAAVSEELSGQAQLLKDMLNRFTLPDTADSAK